MEPSIHPRQLHSEKTAPGNSHAVPSPSPAVPRWGVRCSFRRLSEGGAEPTDRVISMRHAEFVPDGLPQSLDLTLGGFNAPIQQLDLDSTLRPSLTVSLY